ncbi:MAG: hypothetical protein RL701_731 [Pseudomonadota bacterium]
MASQRRRRKRAQRIGVFNHKGGVGKTTLTLNLAAMLARTGSRVLVVDADPQCNLTSYLIRDELIDALLEKAASSRGQTLWSAVRSVSSTPAGKVQRVGALRTAVPNLFLLPGDIRLAEFENELADSFAQCFQRKPKGFHGTAAISQLVTQLAERLQADYVLYDSGPNVGPLNHALFLDCDRFLVPVASDVLSLCALKTLGHALAEWITRWQAVAALAPSELPLLRGRPSFLGYVLGEYRVYGGRVVQRQPGYAARIGREVFTRVAEPLQQISPELARGTRSQFKLGDVPDYASLVAASHREGAPLYDVDAGTAAERRSAEQTFVNLCRKLVARAAAGTAKP